MAKVSFLSEPGNVSRVVINVESVGLSPEQFFRLCFDNPDTRIELTAQKAIIIMAPTNPITAMQNAKIIAQLVHWAEKEGSGIVFDSNGLFTLPNGAKRSPDASWILKPHWHAVKPHPSQHFVKICPDFVLELTSPTDRLKEVHAKMTEYIANGARLGFLVHPRKRQGWIYRPNQGAQLLDNPSSVSGEPELPGFVLNLTKIWN